ncbi:DUF2461 domain-containing protein [Longimicrobium sp.]|uniref:DUF2461 domain-containing protein n=1 Tax=Longimicrobium sp. TaxID=2029185 RepID=UPI002CBEE2B0|nr:DUF2461 domain-containing protein [Longimicrobium sp.]HSU16133.1 DUF2461 domain-containing protein [Longimicrobium sp.]
MDFPRLSRYLAGLAAHNDKAWFEANRAEFQALREEFAAYVGRVIAGIAEWDASVRWVDPADCIYRIHRDVRFSRDKTPYKTTFSAVIHERGRRGGGPSYYFQVDHNGVLMAGGGVWMPEPERLALIREHVAAHPERLRAILDAPGFRAAFDGLWDGHTLKRPPAGYSADAPLIGIIKLKSFIVERERGVSAEAGDVTPWLLETFRAMHPFLAWLGDAVTPRCDRLD